MRRFTLFIVSAALGAAPCGAAWAYNGGIYPGTSPDFGRTPLPIMMQLDAAPGSAPDAPAIADRDLARPTQQLARPLARRTEGDAFQRYFDRHFRAHLVLDAAAMREIDVE
jgi:hypothetical protein